MTDTAAKFSNNDNETAACPDSLSGIWTSESLTKGLLEATREWLTSLPPASPVSHFQLPERDEAIRMNETCGLPQSSAFAWYDLNSSCWRTFQVSLFTNMCDEFTGTWPKAGIVLNGVAYRRQKWEQTIAEIGGGLWPTPQSRDWKGKSQRGNHGNETDCLPNAVGGQLNPTWIDWLMGFPLGWSGLKPLAMHKFQQWLRQFGDY